MNIRRQEANIDHILNNNKKNKCFFSNSNRLHSTFLGDFQKIAPGIAKSCKNAKFEIPIFAFL